MTLATVVIVIAAATTILVLALSRARLGTSVKNLQIEVQEQANAIRSSQQHQELMFSANPYPMWISDQRTLRFLQVNDAAVKAYGYSREEFLRMAVSDIRPEEDIPEFRLAERDRVRGKNCRPAKGERKPQQQFSNA